jgi:uncharacterized protein (TIGR02147 family)
MKAQTAIQKKINERLSEAKLKNPSFSIRAFAKRLGVSPTTLSLLLSGRRRVSPKLAKSLVDRLDLSPAEAKEILSLLPSKRPYRRATDLVDSEQAQQLTMDQYHVVSEWHHFGLRALLRTRDAQSSSKNFKPEWLAERLGVKSRDVSSAIERLLRLEMIERLPDGGLRSTDASFHSPDGIPSVSIRRNHAQHLDLARASLERDSVEVRDFTNLTMAINPKKLSEAKAIIRRFRKEIESVLEDDSTGPRQEVYSLAVQLFPLTRVFE